jgi:hypothetical protein
LDQGIGGLFMPEQLDFLNKAAMGEMLNRLCRAFTKQHFFLR